LRPRDDPRVLARRQVGRDTAGPCGPPPRPAGGHGRLPPAPSGRPLSDGARAVVRPAAPPPPRGRPRRPPPAGPAPPPPPAAGARRRARPGMPARATTRAAIVAAIVAAGLLTLRQISRDQAVLPDARPEAVLENPSRLYAEEIHRAARLIQDDQDIAHAETR